MNRKWWWVSLLVATALAYTALFLSLNNIPFTDAPNHMARATIMTSLWADPASPFRGTYSVHHVFMPYLLPDLLLIPMLRIGLGYAAWATLTMLVLAGAIMFYSRRLLSTWWAKCAAALLAWYFATNYLFVMGFFAFQWGIAAAFIALGALEAGWPVLYVVACVACYGSHLAAFAILAAVVGSFCVFRVLRGERSWGRLLWDLLPLAAIAAYHLLFVPSHPEAAGGIVGHNTVGDKLGHFLEALFVRRNYVVDRSILALFFAIVIGSIWVARKGDFRRQWELLVTCGVAALIYFVLPFGVGTIFYIDERALPFFYVPLVILTLRLLEGSNFKGPTLLLSACTVLAAANLGSLASFLPAQNREVGRYREALRMIPSHKLVLTVNTRQRDGNTWPMRHVGSFYAMDRDGYVPYLFSTKNSGGPSGYFVDLASFYQPPPNWYTDAFTPDWGQIERTYDYLVVTKPWSKDRMEMKKLEMIYENSVATVFQVRQR